MRPYVHVGPSLPPGVWSRPRRARLPFPLDDPACRLFSRARKGLWHAVRALDLPPGSKALVPSYHHGSEVEALLRAGLECRFYHLDSKLQPDEDDLDRLLEPDVRVLHLIHYLGFPADPARWRRWCDERSVVLIEDAAQAWLSTVGGRPVGSFGDIAIFCLYKMVGVPDGGAIVAKHGVARPADPARLGLGPVARRHASWLGERVGPMAAVRRQVERRRTYSVKEDIALGPPDTPASRATLHLLPRVADPSVAERRRSNFRFLLNALGEWVAPAFADLPEGAAPLVFPVDAADKRALMERLDRFGVYAGVLWPNPHPSLPVEEFPEATLLRERLIGLPVHHELSRSALERIVAAVRA